VGLIVSAIAAGTGSIRHVAFTSCGYGYSYETGNNNEPGYGTCPTTTTTQTPPGPGGTFAQGKVFTVERGQDLTLSGTSGQPNSPGEIVIDKGGSTSASARSASTPQEQVIGTFVTDQNGAFTTTVTIPSGLSFGQHKISAVVNGQVVAQAIVIVVPDLHGDGYRMIAGDGGSFNYGNNKFLGSVPGQLNGALPNKPIVGGDNTPSNQGYWMVASDGGMFTFGDAQQAFFGSLPDKDHLNGKLPPKPIVGMARTPTGQGYYMEGSDGKVYTFGDAAFFGDLPSINVTPNRPVNGMAVTPTGKGYWLAASDGGVFAFGDAQFLGSVPGDLKAQGGPSLPNQPILAIGASPTGNGYVMGAADGGLFYYGDVKKPSGPISVPAQLNGKLPNKPIVGMHVTPDGNGIRLAASDGGAFNFGAAKFLGSVPGDLAGKTPGGLPNLPIVALSRL